MSGNEFLSEFGTQVDFLNLLDIAFDVFDNSAGFVMTLER